MKHVVVGVSPWLFSRVDLGLDEVELFLIKYDSWVVEASSSLKSARIFDRRGIDWAAEGQSGQLRSCEYEDTGSEEHDCGMSYSQQNGRHPRHFIDSFSDGFGHVNEAREADMLTCPKNNLAVQEHTEDDRAFSQDWKMKSGTSRTVELDWD